jgi:hypothetical protein
MNNQFNEMWSNWIKSQEKAMNFWKESMLPAQTPSAQDEGKAGNAATDFQKDQEKMFDMWKAWMAQPAKLMESFNPSGFNPQQFHDMMMEMWKKWSSLSPTSFAGTNFPAATPAEMFEMWKEWISIVQSGKFTEQFMSEEFKEKMLEFWKNGFYPKEFLENSAKLYQDWLKTATLNYSQFTQYIPNGIARDAFEKTVKSMEMYAGLKTFWETAMKMTAGKNDVEKWQDFCRTWLQNYGKVFDPFVTSLFPEPIKTVVIGPIENSVMYQQMLAGFFRPWTEIYPDMQQAVFRMMEGDRQAYLDVLRLWHETLLKNHGKMPNIPAIGGDPQIVKKFIDNLETYIAYMAAVNEFTSVMRKVGIEAMEKVTKKVTEMALEGKAPETFEDFYKLWWQTNEQAYIDLFKTDSFAKILGETVDAGVNLKKGFDNLISDYISNFPIITRKEMDSVEKSMYQMRKEIKELTRRVKDLTVKVEDLSAQGGAAQ